MTDDTTITVSDSAVPGQIGTTFRQVALLAGGWAVGKGYLDNTTLSMLVTLATILGPLAYGQYRQWQNHREKRALAISAPIGTLK